MLFGVYTTELFPTEVRLRANGICNTLGRAATIVSPFIVFALFKAYGVVGVIGLMIALLIIQIAVVYLWGSSPTSGRSKSWKPKRRRPGPPPTRPGPERPARRNFRPAPLLAIVENGDLTKGGPPMTQINRRSLLAGSALAAAALPVAALAKAPPAGKQAAGLYRYKLGDYELTALHDGIWNRRSTTNSCAMRPSPRCSKALADVFVPTDELPIPFTALLVEHRRAPHPLDTGTAGQMTATAGTLPDNLAARRRRPRRRSTPS